MWTHQEMGVECERLGLPEPPPAANECAKRDRVSRSVAALPDVDLPMVAERILMGTIPLSKGPATRYAIEDVLWSGQGSPEIPKRTSAGSP
jgi:hypothetical protein